jgi:hypothetical protein
MNKEQIKVGYCVAYDWDLLRYSIPTIYEEADVICLSIDRNRQSWTGKPFTWDEQGFRALVAKLDTAGKIRIYEDGFYLPELSPMANEVRQRNMIAAFLDGGGWHVQLDADEYFLDFAGFVRYLRKLPKGRTVNVCCPMINLYKQTEEGMLWIRPENFSQVEIFTIATRHPKYEYGRRNGYFNILTKFPILHQSWARSEQEIWEKLTNWGHAKDFDVKEYFNLWKGANGKTYSAYRNFHHLHPESWPALSLKKGVRNIDELLQSPGNSFPLPIRDSDLRSANSIWLSRMRALIRRFKAT